MCIYIFKSKKMLFFQLPLVAAERNIVLVFKCLQTMLSDLTIKLIFLSGSLCLTLLILHSFHPGKV